jgi:hypothetical protein
MPPRATQSSRAQGGGALVSRGEDTQERTQRYESALRWLVWLVLEVCASGQAEQRELRRWRARAGIVVEDEIVARDADGAGSGAR